MDVRLPDGTILRGVPDGTTKAELQQKLAGRYGVPALGEQSPPQFAPAKPKQEPSFARKVQGFGNSLLNGQSFGFGDDISGISRAALDYVMPGIEGVSGEGQSFAERARMYREDARQSQRELRNTNPVLAYGSEIGASIPTAIASGGAINPMTAGAIAGVGYSEEDTTLGILKDGLIGGVLGRLSEPAANMVGGIVKRAYRAFGERPTKAIVHELGRIIRQSGKTADEVIEDIASGRVIAENETLTALIRSMRSKGGKAADQITDNLISRQKTTRRAALDEIQEQLAPDINNPNVFKAMTRSDEALGEIESAAYKKVFDGNKGDLPESISKTVLEAVQSVPEAATEVSRLYKVSNLVPLIKTTDSGAIELARIPTLEDAEIVRRVLRDTAGADFRSGKGTVGAAIETIRRKLQGQLDDYAPDLKSARQAASKRRQNRDAFKAGRTALSKPADEVSVMLEDMDAQGALAAFKAGAADAVRNKAARSPGLMARIADTDRNEGMVLSELLTSPDRALGLADIAAGANAASNKIRNGSLTAPQQDAGKFLDSLGGLEHMTLFGGSVKVLDKVREKLSRTYSNMSEAQQMELVKYLYSTNPAEVSKVLSGAYTYRQIADKVARFNTLVDKTKAPVGLTATVAGASLAGRE